MNKKDRKYEFVEGDTIQIYHNGKRHTLHRIRATRNIGIPVLVKKGDLGGYIEAERNLDHQGGCWVADNAKALENASICADAWLCDNATAWDSAIV